MAKLSKTNCNENSFESLLSLPGEYKKYNIEIDSVKVDLV